MNAIDLGKIREIFDTVIGSEIFAYGDYAYTGAYGDDAYLDAYTVCPHDPDPDATCAGTCAEEDPANFICFNRVPIGYENAPPSSDMANAVKTKTPNCQVVIREGRARAVSCGSNVVRRYIGVVIITILQAKDGGSSILRLVATRLNNRILSAHVPSSLSIRTPSFAIIGKSDDWFQGNLTIPFEFDQLTN